MSLNIRLSEYQFMDYVHPRFLALGRNEYAQRRNEAVSVIYDVDQKECPYCHSRSVIRSEHVKSNHRSRYYCKDYHHSFVSSINTVYYRGRLGQHEVRSFSKLFSIYKTHIIFTFFEI